MGEILSGKSLQPEGPGARDPGLLTGAQSSAAASSGAGFVLLAAALWALITPLSRLMIAEGIHPMEMAFWRAVIAWGLFVPHLAIRGRGRDSWKWRVRPSDLPGIAAFAVLGVAALYATLPFAVREGGAALASVLLYTAPAWVAVLSWGLLGERLTRAKILALVLAIGGIATIAASGGGTMSVTAAALAWGLAAALSYASLFLFGKRYFSRYDPATVFFYALPIAALCLFPLTSFAQKSPLATGALAVTGVLSTYGAYLAYSAGLMRLGATRVATIATAEPVIAGALAFMLFGERFTSLGFVGAGAVILGVLIAARR